MEVLQNQNNGFIEKGLKDCIASINKNIKNVNLLEKSDKPEIIKNIETNIMKELECFVSLFNAVSNLRDTMESATIPSSLYNDLVNVKGKLSDINQSAKKCLSKNVIDFHNYILTRVMQALETPSGSDVKSTKDSSYNLNKIIIYIIFNRASAYSVQNISFYSTSDSGSVVLQGLGLGLVGGAGTGGDTSNSPPQL